MNTLLSAICLVTAVALINGDHVPAIDVTGVNPLFSSTYLGCWKDDKVRAMSKRLSDSHYNSPGECAYRCSELGYMFAAVQYGKECFCGDSYERYGMKAESKCNFKCPGAVDVHCGGEWHMSVYRTDPYLGCYKDAKARSLPYQLSDSHTNSPFECSRRCALAGYKFAGVQYSNQCFCGNTYHEHPQVDDSECDMRCPGNAMGFACGGEWRQNIYRAGKYLGCFNQKAKPALTYRPPYKTHVGTPAECRNACKLAGYKVAGVKNGNECFCGKTVPGGRPWELECPIACPRSQGEKCGGRVQLSVYVSN